MSTTQGTETMQGASAEYWKELAKRLKELAIEMKGIKDMWREIALEYEEILEGQLVSFMNQEAPIKRGKKELMRYISKFIKEINTVFQTLSELKENAEKYRQEWRDESKSIEDEFRKSIQAQQSDATQDACEVASAKNFYWLAAQAYAVQGLWREIALECENALKSRLTSFYNLLTYLHRGTIRGKKKFKEYILTSMNASSNVFEKLSIYKEYAERFEKDFEDEFRKSLLTS